MTRNPANWISSVIMFTLVVLIACSPERKALKNFRYEKFEEVIDYFQGVLTRQPSNGKANYYIAESYRQSNRIK